MNKFMTIIGIGLLSISLAACSTTSTTIVTRDVYIGISPPDTLYNCPQIKNYPNPDTLTNKELADLITKLVVNNKTCYTNMKSIQQYVAKVKEQINQRNKK